MGSATSAHTWQPVMAADWHDEACVLLDQRLLPGEERYLSLRSAAEVYPDPSLGRQPNFCKGVRFVGHIASGKAKGI